MGFGALYLLAGSGAYLAVMASLAWHTVLTGAYIVYRLKQSRRKRTPLAER